MKKAASKYFLLTGILFCWYQHLVQWHQLLPRSVQMQYFVASRNFGIGLLRGRIPVTCINYGIIYLILYYFRTMLSAIILSAGSSKRMEGENKLLLPFFGATIIEYVVKNILAAGITEVIIVTGFENEKIETALKNYPVQCVHNPNHEKGMTTSIQVGVSVCNGDGYMICLGDMVAITANEYAMLKDQFEILFAINASCICIPVYNSKRGNPVIFSATYRDEILAHTEMEGCKKIVQSNQQNVYEVVLPFDHILQDIDYKSDYKKLVSL